MSKPNIINKTISFFKFSFSDNSFISYSFGFVEFVVQFLKNSTVSYSYRTFVHDGKQLQLLMLIDMLSLVLKIE